MVGLSGFNIVQEQFTICFPGIQTIIVFLFHFIFNNMSLISPFYHYLISSPFSIFLLFYSFHTFLPLCLIYLFPSSSLLPAPLLHTSSSLLDPLNCSLITVTSSSLTFFTTFPPLLSAHYHSPLSLLQCDCGASAGRFILRHLRVLGWRGGVEEVSFQSHVDLCTS